MIKLSQTRIIQSLYHFGTKLPNCSAFAGHMGGARKQASKKKPCSNAQNRIFLPLKTNKTTRQGAGIRFAKSLTIRSTRTMGYEAR